MQLSGSKQHHHKAVHMNCGQNFFPKTALCKEQIKMLTIIS